MKHRFNITVAAFGLWLAFSSLSAQVLLPTSANTHDKVSLNGKWKFKYIPSAETGVDSLFYQPGFDISQWGNIKTPGNWELQGFDEPIYGKTVKNATGLYRTDFVVPAGWQNNPVYLCFDGVSFGYKVWVNGKYAGEYASSFNRQTFDISNLISVGKTNALAVKVITHPKGWEFDTNDDWSLSGIIRDVTLFTLPPVHIKDLVVKTFVKDKKATLSVNTLIEQSFGKDFPQNLSLSARLLDATGKLVKEFPLTGVSVNWSSDTASFSQSVTLENPSLWTAETPDLYTLRLSLKVDTAEIQQYTERIGIREVSWTDGILKLNGTPIKLRGINHPDISPVNGRCITEAEMLTDLKLMQKANINFIRIAHYPPQARFLELCDSLGFYVMNEVPYGFGEEHLKKASYLSVLMQRVKATVWRDKNRPCVITWSVGNENPVTEIGLKTGRYVKQLDNTRPYCFPQYPSEFEKMLQNMPDSLDVLDDHYAAVSDLNKYVATIDRPLILGEYAHSLGLDFNSMEAVYETMYAHPKLAGGAVWSFMDQGILRKAPRKITKDEYTLYAWASPDSIYDTGGNQGTDGVVYANRIPQVDYWQVRKVYSPVKALDDTLQYKSGNQTFSVKLVNRFDFTNLSDVCCKWELIAGSKIVTSGTIPLNCMPHDTLPINIHAVLPPQPASPYYYLKLSFEDKANYRFYEKSYLIQTQERALLLDGIMAKNSAAPVTKDNVIVGDKYRFEFSKDSGSIQLKNKGGNLLIAAGPFARTGRKPSISQNAAVSKKNNEKHTIPTQYLWTKADVNVKTEDAHQLIMDYQFLPDTLSNSSIEGKVAYQFSDSGFIHVNYRFIPQGKAEALETGISFLVPAFLTEFRWVGNGPYEAYPGKTQLSEFGIYHLNSKDLYFAGNRQNVSCAVFSDAKGNGFAIIADKANISVERSREGLVVSHNAYVAGRFNKYKWPDDLYAFSDGKAITGSFTIVPLTTVWPKMLQALFGNYKKPGTPFQPFYHSYDQ